MVKIASVEAENVKRVKAVYLEPRAEGLTVIGGSEPFLPRRSTPSAGRWAATSCARPTRPARARRAPRRCAWCWTTASWWSAAARTAR